MKNFHSKVSFILAFASLIPMSMNTNVFAEKLNQSYYIYDQFENSEISNSNFQNNISSEKVEVIENNNFKKISIKNLDADTLNFIIVNYKDDTIYSSFTGKTESYSNFVDKASGISTYSKSSYSSFRMSYSEIRSYIGDRASAGGVVGLAVALVPGAEPVGGLIGTVSTLIGGANLFVPNDSSHGLIFTFKTVKYHRTRVDMRTVYRTDKYIANIEKY